MERYDAIVIGAGHNGLTAAVLLQRAGLRTVCLEAKRYAGGMASTVEMFDGYKFEIAGSLQFPTSPAVSRALGLDTLPTIDTDVMSVSTRGIGDAPVIYYTDLLRLMTHLDEVHGGEVVNVAGIVPLGLKADAVVTREANRVLAVRVADCVPILLASDDGRTVAAVHAGWRGVIAGAVANAVRVMDVPPARLLAAIGPCIGFESFEVGPEVLAAFKSAFPAAPPIAPYGDATGKGTVDLRSAVRQQLLAIGVGESRIDTTDRCTVRDAGEFFSHRRDAGVTGRMARSEERV